RVRAVQLGVLEPHGAQRLDAFLGLGHELVAESELDRLRRARLGARRSESIVDAIVTERAFSRRPRLRVERDDTERARGHAVATAVANVLVDVHRSVLGAVDGAGRAGLETAGLRAVLADVGHEQPRQIPVRLGLLDEAHESEGLVREVGVVLVAARPLRLLEPELVPLLAGDLARAAADAQRRVREHRERARHGYTTPFFTLQTKAFVSWM